MVDSNGIQCRTYIKIILVARIQKNSSLYSGRTQQGRHPQDCPVSYTHLDVYKRQATSCGGVVIHRGKILALYKSYRNRYEGWVLPKGTVEKGETFEQTALREVMEEAGVRASIVKYIGKSQDVYKRQSMELSVTAIPASV